MMGGKAAYYYFKFKINRILSVAELGDRHWRSIFSISAIALLSFKVEF